MEYYSLSNIIYSFSTQSIYELLDYILFLMEWFLDLTSKGLFGYRLLLKIENWKHCNKIIFKYVNSAVNSFLMKVLHPEVWFC